MFAIFLLFIKLLTVILMFAIFCRSRNMSSKRKNTPTKLAKGDGLDDVVMENGNDSHPESDADSESCLTMAADRGVDDYTDGGSPGSDRPQSKKQRLLQSVQSIPSDMQSLQQLQSLHAMRELREDSEEEDYPYNNNNNILTKPSPIGLNHRKSMDNVLRRLNKTSADQDLDNVRSNQEDILENLKAQISSADNMEDKEQKLAEMIAQLQSLRESIKKEKTPEIKPEDSQVRYLFLIRK